MEVVFVCHRGSIHEKSARVRFGLLESSVVNTSSPSSDHRANRARDDSAAIKAPSGISLCSNARSILLPIADTLETCTAIMSCFSILAFAGMPTLSLLAGGSDCIEGDLSAGLRFAAKVLALNDAKTRKP